MPPTRVSIRLAPRESEGNTLVISMEAKPSPFIAGMIRPRLEETVRYIANMLEQIHYNV